MKLKKLAIGFVIALSAALALNAVSKTTPRDNASESDNQQQTILLTGANETIVR